MLKNPQKSAAAMAFAVILAVIILAGCGSSVTQTPASSSGQQSATQPTQQQPSGSSGQKPDGAQGQQPPGGAQNKDAVMKRAAEILGIDEAKFTAAFKNAMPAPPSGQQGLPPATPSSGQQGQPLSGAQQGQSPGGARDMTAIYEKMATELGISADDIAKAMAQAEQELKNSK